MEEATRRNIPLGWHPSNKMLTADVRVKVNKLP